jgi:biotin-(acetyl-CoA carboxylase) ligase
MGFNHCYISSVENLQSEFERKGLEEFVKSYRKYDAITGPSESFRFLEEKQKQYEEYINNIDNNSNTDKL